MPARFHAPDLEPSDQSVALPHDEAQHLVRTLRIERGAEVRVFNGRGFECRAVVEIADRGGVVLRTVAPVRAALELPFDLTLAQAVLKGDKFDEVVRDATMLGVTAVQPLATRNVDVPHASLARGRRVERWERIAVSSAKQCGRAVVPRILQPLTFAETLTATAGAARVVLVEPGRHPDVLAIGNTPRPPGAAVVLVGPEGGWSPEEVEEAARAGAHLVTLGTRTLRAEAVAMVGLPVLLYAWGVL